MIKRITLFLGPARAQALFFLFGGTGLASLILNSIQETWVRPAQSLLLLAFLIGAAIIVGGRLDAEERGRWAGLLLPAVGAVILGLTVLPQYGLPLLGAGVGWVIAGAFIFRAKMPMQYQQAVKHLRRSEYAEAVKVLDDIIKAEPTKAQHYRFRAEVLRLWGKLDRAKRDYVRMTELEPDSAVAFNGLAEVLLQAGDYYAALDAANQAYALAPGEWVAAYNLGMIEDRLGDSPRAVEHLQKALALKVPDARHRLLMRFYLVRAYTRLGDLSAAQREIDALKKQRSGLQEWQAILESEQAETLRVVLGEDIEAAGRLIDGTLDAAALAQTAGGGR